MKVSAFRWFRRWVTTCGECGCLVRVSMWDDHIGFLHPDKAMPPVGQERGG